MASRRSSRMSAPLSTLLLLVFFFTSSTLAAAATSFCKCICNSNSTIIPLNGNAADLPRPPSATDTSSTPPRRGGSCNDCNRQFCIDYNLPICKDAKEEDVSTMCFQRDSAKDQAVVYTFIILTVGLLVYAALKPWLDKRMEASHERRSYSIVSGGGGNT